MTTYLCKSVRRSERVEPGETMTVWCDPGGRGAITVVGSVFTRPSTPKNGPKQPAQERPAQHRLELLRPGSTNAVALSTRTALTSQLVHTASAADLTGAGRWTARLTNLEDYALDFVLEVTYPTDTILVTASIKLADIHALAALVLRTLSLHLESGKNDDDPRSELNITHICVRMALDKEKVTFPIKFPINEVIVWDAPPSLSEMGVIFVREELGASRDIVARIHDINSEHVDMVFEPASAAFRHGALLLRVRFESSGTEIVVEGGPDIELLDMNLEIRLALVARGGLVSWEWVDAKFPVRANIKGFPDWLISPFFNPAKTIRKEVEHRAKSLLDNAATRRVISEFLTQTLLNQAGVELGEAAYVHEVKVLEDRLDLVCYAK